MAIIYDGGVLIGADSRTSSVNYLARIHNLSRGVI